MMIGLLDGGDLIGDKEQTRVDMDEGIGVHVVLCHDDEDRYNDIPVRGYLISDEEQTSVEMDEGIGRHVVFWYDDEDRG